MEEMNEEIGVSSRFPLIARAMRRESADFPGAFCDKSAKSGDGVGGDT